MTLPRRFKHFSQLLCCCICGMQNCLQSVDHERVEVDHLKQIMLQSKKNIPQVDILKAEVKTKFYKLKTNLVAMLNNKESEIVRQINRLYFTHLGDQTKNIAILSDLLENDFTRFPNRQIYRTVKTINKANDNKKEQQSQIDKIIEQVEQMLKKLQIQKIVSNFSKQINIENILKNSTNKKLSQSIKSYESSATASSRSQKKLQLGLGLETYQWKYIKFTKNTKTVELNNRNIKDEDMIRQLPVISIFQNIREFQIRNNKITALTCSIIANNMKFLTILDLRGNKIGDTGVSKVVLGIPNLKSLFVSQTGITDITGDLLADNLPQLQTLWSQHTKLTGQSCLKIAQKPKLRILSLLGNFISPQHKENIQLVFRSKGYLNI